MYLLARKTTQKIILLLLWCTTITTSFFRNGYNPLYNTLYIFFSNVKDIYLREELLHGSCFPIFSRLPSRWMNFIFPGSWVFYLKCEILLSSRVKCVVSKLIHFQHVALLFLAIFNILLSWNILQNFSEMPFV